MTRLREQVGVSRKTAWQGKGVVGDGGTKETRWEVWGGRGKEVVGDSWQEARSQVMVARCRWWILSDRWVGGGSDGGVVGKSLRDVMVVDDRVVVERSRWRKWGSR